MERNKSKKDFRGTPRPTPRSTKIGKKLGWETYTLGPRDVPVFDLDIPNPKRRKREEK